MKQKTTLSALEFLLILMVMSITAGLVVPYYRLHQAERVYTQGL